MYRPRDNSASTKKACSLAAWFLWLVWVCAVCILVYIKELFCLNPLFLVNAVYREMKVRQLTVYSVPTHSEINSFSCHRNMSLETDLKISFKIMSLDPEFLVDCCQQIWILKEINWGMMYSGFSFIYNQPIYNFNEQPDLSSRIDDCNSK